MKQEPETAWVIEMNERPWHWEDNSIPVCVVIGSRQYAQQVCHEEARANPHALVYLRINRMNVIREES